MAASYAVKLTEDDPVLLFRQIAGKVLAIPSRRVKGNIRKKTETGNVHINQPGWPNIRGKVETVGLNYHGCCVIATGGINKTTGPHTRV